MKLNSSLQLLRFLRCARGRSEKVEKRSKTSWRSRGRWTAFWQDRHSAACGRGVGRSDPSRVRRTADLQASQTHQGEDAPEPPISGANRDGGYFPIQEPRVSSRRGTETSATTLSPRGAALLSEGSWRSPSIVSHRAVYFCATFAAYILS